MQGEWNFTPLFLSIKLATCTVVILFPLMVILAWWLSRGGIWKVAIRAILTLPMVLPPTVLGFYLLVMLAPSGTIGAFLDQLFGIRMVFTFPGMLVASLIVTTPFMLNPLLAGFESLPKGIIEAARLLGKKPWTILWRVQLPNMIPSLLTASVLAMAHAMGEFGVILMIGGKIPGETLVASMAIYDLVESMEYASAGKYALVLSSVSFCALISVMTLERRSRRLI